MKRIARFFSSLTGAALAASVFGAVCSLFSIYTAVVLMFSEPKNMGDQLALILLNAFLFGPVFIIGTVLSLCAKENRGFCLSVNCGYLFGWVLIVYVALAQAGA